MDPGAWWIVAATVAGPILAVQAQKAVEGIRERRTRKAWVFQTLMATRADRVSADHVQALNMIDLVFYGKRVLGIQRRTKAEQSVIDTWKEYLDHLNTKADDKALPLWIARGDELFVNVLYAIAKDVGLKFDRVQLKKGAYSPVAHDQLQLEHGLIRKLMVRALAGEQPLKMHVTSLPFDEAAAKAQLQNQERLAAALERLLERLDHAAPNLAGGPAPLSLPPTPDRP
jgi:hypothetical protein